MCENGEQSEILAFERWSHHSYVWAFMRALFPKLYRFDRRPWRLRVSTSIETSNKSFSHVFWSGNTFFWQWEQKKSLLSCLYYKHHYIEPALVKSTCDYICKAILLLYMTYFQNNKWWKMLSGIFYTVDINLIGKNRYFILKCELMDLVKGPFTSKRELQR